MKKNKLDSVEFCKHVAKHTGLTISLLKRERAVTSTSLAKRIGVSVQQLIKYESGENRVSLGRLILICDYLQYNVYDLMQDILSSIGKKEYKKLPALININLLSDVELSIINKFIKDITSNVTTKPNGTK